RCPNWSTPSADTLTPTPNMSVPPLKVHHGSSPKFHASRDMLPRSVRAKNRGERKANVINPLSHSPRRTASGLQLPNRADAYAGGFHDSIDSNFTMCTDRIGVRVLVNRHHVGPLSRVVHSGLTRPDLTGRQ